MQRWYWAVVMLALVSACATAPEPLRGEFSGVTPQTAQNATGQHVRWGGKIIKTSPGQNETCFEILSYRLNESARPVEGDNTQGRFIACAPGFYDPDVYARERAVTVVGTLSAPITGKVGDYDYRYPRVAAQTVRLWPVQPKVYAVPRYYDPFYDPFFPFGYGPHRHRHWPH